MTGINPNEDLKRQHEQAAAQRFLDWLKQNRGRSLVISSKTEAPDFECTDGASGATVGLEVSTAYYDEHHAKGAWDLARGRTRQYASDVLQNPDEGLADSINNRLSDKCKKQYTVSFPVVLVVDSRPPLTDEQDVQDTILPAIRLPAQVPFQEIYLGVDIPIGRSSPHGGQYWVWRVYPPLS